MSDRKPGWQVAAGVLSLSVLFLMVALAAPLASAESKPPGKKRLVCWTDDAGNRACGDAVPARYAGKQKQILDETGRTVKTIPGALTPAQRAAQELQLQQEAEAKRAAEQQAAYDRALTATYSTPQDLAALRDDRIATIDSTIDIREAAARRDSVTLAELRTRLPPADSKTKPPAGLLKNIGQYEESLAENQRVVADLLKSRENICSTFARDIHRFQELKSGTVDFDSACPPRGSFAKPEHKIDLAAARSFFDRWVEMERDHDPELLALYADEGVVKVRSIGADGKATDAEMTMAEHRKALVKALPLAKERHESRVYSNLTVTDEGNGRAKISGTRTSTLTKIPASFYVVLKPSGQSWRIAEEWTEQRAATP